MKNIDIFDPINTPTVVSDVETVQQQQPVPEPVSSGVGIEPTVEPSLLSNPTVNAPVVPQSEPIPVMEYQPTSEISKALIDNKADLEMLGIDGNRYDQFVAEVLPKAMETKKSSLALVGTPEFYDQIAGKLIGNESGGNYKAIEKGSAQAFGKYQFTPARLKHLGYTGTMKEFLDSPKDQEAIFTKHMDTNYKWLEKQGMVDAHTSPADVTGYLYAMHLGGYGAAKTIAARYQEALRVNPEAKLSEVVTRGTGARDSNGTSIGKYFLDGYKYGSRLMKNGVNSADDVVYKEARQWAASGKNELADRDQAVSPRGNAWLNTIRQYKTPEEAVDATMSKLGNQVQRGDYWSSKRDTEGYHNAGVATEELTYWDRFNASRKNQYEGETATGEAEFQREARKQAEGKLSKALGVTVDIGKDIQGLVTEGMSTSDIMNYAAFGRQSANFYGTSNEEYARRFNDFIAQAQQAHPEIKLPYNSYDDVLIEAGKMQRQSDAEYATIANNYGGFSGGTAGALGTIVGTLQDPIELMKFTALAPIGAQFTAGSIVAGIAANTIAEIPTQYGLYQMDQDMGLNPTVGGAALNVATVGALGGVAPVVGHYLSKGYNATKSLFGKEAADAAEDAVHTVKNSPFPDTPDGGYKMEMMAQKASADIAAGQPVAVVTNDVPVVKMDIKQQLSPDGQIELKYETTFSDTDARFAKEFNGAIEKFNSLGTATKEEYDAFVSRTPKNAVDETQALNGENNYIKQVQRQDDINLQRTREAVKTKSSIKDSSAKSLTDSLEGVRAKDEVGDYVTDPSTSSKVLAMQDELQTLNEAGSEFTVSAARNAREVIDDLKIEKGNQLQATNNQLSQIKTALRSAEKDLGAVEKELGTLGQDTHRAAFLREAREAHFDRVDRFAKAEKVELDNALKLKTEMDRLDVIRGNMVKAQKETQDRLTGLAKTKGADIVKAEVAKRQEVLNKKLKEYQDTIAKKKLEKTSKVDIYDTDEIGGEPTRRATVQELMDETKDELDFLKEVNDCLINIGV